MNGNASNSLSQQILELYNRMLGRKSDIGKQVKKNKADQTAFEKQIWRLQEKLEMHKANFSGDWQADEKLTDRFKEDKESKQNILELENGDL